MRQQFPIALLIIFLAFILQRANSQATSATVLQNAAVETVFPPLAIENIFRETATIPQLEDAIKKGDSLVLSKSLQALIVGPSNISCQEKGRYSDRLTGLMKTEIWSKGYEIS